MQNTVKTQKVPYVKQMAIQMEAYKMLICSRIGWNEATYEDYRFNAALDFIEDMIIGLHPEDRKLITYSAFFWGWFKNKWFERDIQIYNELSLTADDYCGIQDYHLRTCKTMQQSFHAHFNTIIDDGADRIKEEMEGANG
ncbi:MAG: hypothetical protein H7289_07705 [Mucilaginibacter sp.]|nr:hypothetical protein [Mucilaginibacter sp.]